MMKPFAAALAFLLVLTAPLSAQTKPRKPHAAPAAAPAAPVKPPTPSGPPTPAEIKATAKDAYIYAYAMLESYQTWRAQAVDKSSPAYVGGFNVFRHYSQPFTPDNKDIV